MMDALVRKLLLDCGAFLQLSPSDERDIEDISKQRREDDLGLFGTANRIGRVMSPASVSCLLQIFLHRWDEGGAIEAALLDLSGPKGLRADGSDDEALAVALWFATEALGTVDPEEEDTTDWRPLALALAQLSAVVQRLGATDTAYDLVHVAVNRLADDDPVLPDIAAAGTQLAKLGGKPHQIAMMGCRSAAAAVSAAVTDIDRRLVAYNLCEIAIERIAFINEFFRKDFARILMSVLEPHDWLTHLRLRLMPHIATESMRDEYRQLLGAAEWPTRISEMSVDESIALVPAISRLMRAEMDFENERLLLTMRLVQSQVTTDEVDWSFQLPTYTQAVPHSRSLLRERQLPTRLALLTHEVTHVLSLLGHIGAALTALRVAGLDSAISLMSDMPRLTDAEIADLFLKMNGIPELAPGNASKLLAVERQLELRYKAQILWDIWTPWLEGIAVYGELGADPALDPVSINPVTACLRNLVDFMRDEDSKLTAHEQAVAHAYEFEQRCSEALHDSGPERLEDYLRSEDKAYFPGYLAVRAIVARWRLTSGRNFTSVQCFDLLLHATRYGTGPSIPDLSLGSVAFEDQARAGMAAFISGLAAIGRDDLAGYFSPVDPSSPGRFTTWVDYRPIGIEKDEADLVVAQQDAKIVSLIGQALRSLSKRDDLNRFAPQSEAESSLVATFQKAAAASVEQRDRESDNSNLLIIFTGLLEKAAILPIGRCSSPFFLHIHREKGLARLFVNIRTCEEHVDTGRPSYNGLWMPISLESADELTRGYKEEASPRLRVSRVIYLSELQIGEGRVAYPHFLVMQGNNWFDMFGAAGWSQSIQETVPDLWRGVRDLVQRRMTDSTISAVERRFVASGREAIDHTLSWLEASQEWTIGGTAVSVQGWVQHLNALGRSLLNPEVRERTRTAATSAMIIAIYGATDYASAIAGTVFRKLLGRQTILTREFARVLFENGRAAGNSEFLDRSNDNLTAASRTLLERGPFGWDIRPAIQQGDPS